MQHNENYLASSVDATDLKILALLQAEPALPVAELAERVGLSASPCWRRIKRMEEDGIIAGRAVLVDTQKLGLDFEVWATVKLQTPTRENLDAFERAARGWAEVVECATITGAADYVLRIITTDMHAYDDFLRDTILALGTVSDVQSHIVIRVAKRTTAAPLDLVETK
jgi:DNA-binding Lrp family transcriptional regulator